MAGAASSSSTDSTTIPLQTLLHIITIKLSSTNYLLWKNQVFSILSYQNLVGHIDGSISIQPPPETIIVEEKPSPNPAYLTWKETDQRILLLLQSSLTEEAMAETIGLSTSCQVWKALENAYSHPSVERMHTLRDSLRQLQKGSLSVFEYGRKFKSFCDQLAAIGHPVDDTDKCHWFLCGLGSAFETFSTAHRAVYPRPGFRDLLSHAESHEIFLQSIHTSPVPQAALDEDALELAQTVGVEVDNPTVSYVEIMDIMLQHVLDLPPLRNRPPPHSMRILHKPFMPIVM